MNWKNLRVGDVIWLNVSDFDTVKPYSERYTVTDVSENYILARNDGGTIKMYIDKDTQYLFSKNPKFGKK